MMKNPMRKDSRMAVGARLASVAALSAAFWFAGCESQPLSPWDSVRVEVLVSHAELVVPRDTLQVRVVATNTSRRPIALNTWACIQDVFRVRNEAQEFALLVPTGCIPRRPVPHPPGEPVEYLTIWTGEVASDSVPRTSMLVPPGEYQLRVDLRDGDRRLVSAPVTIRVRAVE